MAGETLRTAAQLLTEFPDNTAGLIDAVQGRNHIVSMLPGIGFLEDDTTSFTITVIDGTFVDVNQDITPLPLLAANFAWAIDGNNAWIPDYTSIGITVPAGVQRLVGINTTMLLAKQGGGTASYTWQIFKGGVAVGNGLTTAALGIAAQLITVVEEVLYEPALVETLSLRVRANGTTDNIDVSDFRQRVTSILL